MTPAFADIVKQDVERLEKALASPYIEAQLDLFQSVLRSYEALFPELAAQLSPVYSNRLVEIPGRPSRISLHRLDVNALRSNLSRLHDMLKSYGERLPVYPVQQGKGLLRM